MQILSQGARAVLNRFRSSESGAVTVDFLVLTSVTVVMGTVVVLGIRGGAEKVATDIGTELSAVAVTG